MHSSTGLQQSKCSAVRAPFSSQRYRGRKCSSHVVAASNGETRATTVHKLIEAHGHLLVPGKLSVCSVSNCIELGRAFAAPGADDRVCPVSAAYCKSPCPCEACWLDARAWQAIKRASTLNSPQTERPADCYDGVCCPCAALQAVMMPCQQGSWETPATRQHLSAAMQ
jgi:hypothetical protein